MSPGDVQGSLRYIDQRAGRSSRILSDDGMYAHRSWHPPDRWCAMLVREEPVFVRRYLPWSFLPHVSPRELWDAFSAAADLFDQTGGLTHGEASFLVGLHLGPSELAAAVVAAVEQREAP